MISDKQPPGAQVGGELTYEFSDHSIVLQPGDMAHIPAGEDHKHRPSVVGELQPLISPWNPSDA